MAYERKARIAIVPDVVRRSRSERQLAQQRAKPARRCYAAYEFRNEVRSEWRSNLRQNAN